jgi:hypothetical protein
MEIFINLPLSGASRSFPSQARHSAFHWCIGIPYEDPLELAVKGFVRIIKESHSERIILFGEASLQASIHDFVTPRLMSGITKD